MANRAWSKTLEPLLDSRVEETASGSTRSQRSTRPPRGQSTPSSCARRESAIGTPTPAPRKTTPRARPETCPPPGRPTRSCGQTGCRRAPATRPRDGTLRSRPHRSPATRPPATAPGCPPATWSSSPAAGSPPGTLPPAPPAICRGKGEQRLTPLAGHDWRQAPAPPRTRPTAPRPRCTARMQAGGAGRAPGRPPKPDRKRPAVQE